MRSVKFHNVVFFWLLIFIASNQLQAQCTSFPAIDLGNDTILCPGEHLSLNLNALQNTAETVTWENGSHSFNRTISAAGTYSVEVKFLGENIVENGDFSQGDTGFNTDYTLGVSGSWGPLSDEGTYGVSTSPSALHNNFSYCQDHTGNNGNMMVVNGANTPGTNVWCQTIEVEPDTDYEFSTWITNALYETNVAQLQFSINGIPLGDIFTTSVNGCNWQQFFETWNSGSNTTATICIVNLNTSGGGNDFAIDDISFSPVCIFTDEITVTYNNAPSFTLPQTYNVCEGETLVLDAENEGFDFLWGDGSETQTLAVTSSGTYEVTVADDGYCAESRSFEVIFHEPPSAGADKIYDFCNTEGQVDLYSLIDDPAISMDGLWITEAGAEIVDGLLNIATFEGAYTVKYVVAAEFCAADTADYLLDVYLFSHAGADFEEHFCNEGTVDLNTFVTANKIGSWVDLNGFNGEAFNENSGVFYLSGLPKDDYQFNYVVQNEGPCPNDTSLGTIKMSEVANILFDADKYEGCSPLEVHFTDLTVVNGERDYEWSVNGEFVSNQSQFSHVFEDVYCNDVALKITTDDLCENEVVVINMVCVNPDPIADFTYEPKQVFSDDPHVEFQNNSELNASNEWTFGAFGESTAVHPSFDFPIGKEADYAVKLVVTSEKGCVDSIVKAIPVRDQTLFYVPNTFTPNDDEFNTVFLPVMSVGVDKYNYELKIYNRWGELVFESRDPDYGWDGTYGGRPAKEGTYLWKIQFTEIDATNEVLVNGFVNLLR